MDNSVRVVLYLIVGVLVVIGIIMGRRMAAQRRQALLELAMALQMRFDPEPNREFDDYHTHDIFHQGSSRAAYNRLDGTLEMDGAPFSATMGDYRYTVQSGKSSHTYRFSFLLLRPPWPRLPDLHIRPEHFGDKILGAIGFDDIDFESEEFSRQFMVKSPDKRFAYAVVHPRMMEYLLEVKGPTIEIKDGECLLMAGTSTWDPDTFRTRISWAHRFFGLWPEHLTRQLNGEEESA